MAQFEIGQQELVDLHHHTYEVDLHAMTRRARNYEDPPLAGRIREVNKFLVEKIFWSTQRQADYDHFSSILSLCLSNLDLDL